MFKKNDKIHKRGFRKIDAMVTGMLLGGIVASIYGVKKTSEYLDEKQKEVPKGEKKGIKNILKMLIFGVKSEPQIEEEKKKGFFSRLFKK